MRRVELRGTSCSVEWRCTQDRHRFAYPPCGSSLRGSCLLVNGGQVVCAWGVPLGKICFLTLRKIRLQHPWIKGGPLGFTTHPIWRHGIMSKFKEDLPNLQLGDHNGIVVQLPMSPERHQAEMMRIHHACQSVEKLLERHSTRPARKTNATWRSD